jgi:hypothetical protein
MALAWSAGDDTRGLQGTSRCTRVSLVQAHLSAPAMTPISITSGSGAAAVALVVLVAGAQESPSSWLRSPTDSIPMTIMSFCRSSGGCGVRGHGAALYPVSQELVVPAGTQLAVDIRPGPDEVTFQSISVKQADGSRTMMDRRALHGPRFAAPDSSGVYRYVVAAKWTVRDPAVTGFSNAQWTVQLRVR